MKGYDRSLYGQKIANIYDEHIAEMGIDDPATVATLAEYAGSGRVLELGVGTGRVAIPLALRGVEVHGIDVSEAMLTRLKEKPGGDRVTTIIGDFADVAVEGQFQLIYCVFNTFFSLTTQQEQIACFSNVASHLAPGGYFMLEAFVPDMSFFDRGQRLHVRQLTADRVDLEASVHDPVNQRVYGQSVQMDETEGLKMYPVDLRYAWPSEIDLMARLAGLHYRERWGGWRREPFTVSSTTHVSQYQKPR
ncbi:MAG: class I SAM-dependent DNA methyltransferase [Actinomycetota bacterium]